jgi:hypothetical protein
LNEEIMAVLEQTAASLQEMTKSISETNERVVRIETLLEWRPLCNSDCAINKIPEMDNRIKVEEKRTADLENSKTWGERIVIGAVLLSVMGVVLMDKVLK